MAITNSLEAKAEWDRLSASYDALSHAFVCAQRAFLSNRRSAALRHAMQAALEPLEDAAAASRNAQQLYQDLAEAEEIAAAAAADPEPTSDERQLALL